MMKRFFLCALFSLIFCAQLSGADAPLLRRVPEFARAAALIDGEKLLQLPGNLPFLYALLPGVAGQKLTTPDLAHRYLVFASGDLKVYGMVIRKGKGSLEKLFHAFRSNPETIKLRYENREFLSALWAKEGTPALLLEGKKRVFKHLFKGHIISAAAVIRLQELPGKSPEKLLKEFPELKHLEAVRINTGDKNMQTGIALLFNNSRSPANGFRFLNWGIAFMIWHKTGKFRHIRQETVQKELLLYLADPPLGDIARILVPAVPPAKNKRSSMVNLKELAAGLYLYLAEHQKKLPPDLNTVFQTYIPHPAVYIAPYDTKTRPPERNGVLKEANTSYVYLLPGAELKKIKHPASTPMLMERPGVLPAQRHRLIVSFADGSTAAVRMKSAPQMSCRQAAEELLKRSKGKIPSDLAELILKRAAAADEKFSGNP